MLAVKQALLTNFGKDGLELLQRVSSVVTDGASINIGEKNGFWTLLEYERRSSQTAKSHSTLPVVKIWCAVHRSQLAWQSVSETVIEVKHCFQQLFGLVSYFYTSGVGTRELKKLAAENHFELRSLPTVYEVRWTEFSYALLDCFGIVEGSGFLPEAIEGRSSSKTREVFDVISKPAAFGISC
jgi:hypothetical protein